MKASNILDRVDGYQDIQEYKPYSKRGLSGGIVRLTRSGHMMIGEVVYKEMIAPAHRVNLYYLNGSNGKAIGLRPSEEGGLTVVENRRAKTRHISAKGFLKTFGINVNKTLPISPQFDPIKKLILLAIPDQNNFSPDANNGDHESSQQRTDIAEEMDIKEAILKCLPSRSSGKPPVNRPELILPVAELLGSAKPRKNTRPRKNLQNRINNALSLLEIQGKVEVDHKQPYKGKNMSFYYKHE